MDKYISDMNLQAKTEKELTESVDDQIAEAKERAGQPDRKSNFPAPLWKNSKKPAIA